MAAPQPSDVRFFATPKELRVWFVESHETAGELWLGYYKKATGKPSVTWPQSVEQALCFGWIDGIRRSLGDDSYCIRFSPHRPGSHWSAVNVATMERLLPAGMVTEAGRAAYARRDPQQNAEAWYERAGGRFSAELQARLDADAQASAFYAELPPSVRKLYVVWLMSAKREETRERRFATVLECDREGRRIPQLQPPNRS